MLEWAVERDYRRKGVLGKIGNRSGSVFRVLANETSCTGVILQRGALLKSGSKVDSEVRKPPIARGRFPALPG